MPERALAADARSELDAAFQHLTRLVFGAERRQGKAEVRREHTLALSEFGRTRGVGGAPSGLQCVEQPAAALSNDRQRLPCVDGASLELRVTFGKRQQTLRLLRRDHMFTCKRRARRELGAAACDLVEELQLFGL